MQVSTLLIISCVCIGALAMPRHVPCVPGTMEDNRTGKVCGALEAILEYVADTNERESPSSAAEIPMDLYAENPEFNVARKRQELIHKFLRFGRRR